MSYKKKKSQDCDSKARKQEQIPTGMRPVPRLYTHEVGPANFIQSTPLDSVGATAEGIAISQWMLQTLFIYITDVPLTFPLEDEIFTKNIYYILVCDNIDGSCYLQWH